MIYWEGYNDFWAYSAYQDCLNPEYGFCEFHRWKEIWPEMNLFDPDGSISWTEV
jgi:hypothetical protein